MRFLCLPIWTRPLAIGGTNPTLTPGIESFLLPFSRRRPVIGHTTLAGTLPALMIPTTERTSQIRPACVTGMRKKPNPAGDAETDTPLELRMGSQHRVQRHLILPNQRRSTLLLVPIRPKRKNFLDGNDKKAKFSVIIQIVLFTTSSYPIDAKASRGRARSFSTCNSNTPT